MVEGVCMEKAVTLLFFFFSVYVPGNSSAVLLNNETCVCECVCVYMSVTKSLLNK